MREVDVDSCASVSQVRNGPQYLEYTQRHINLQATGIASNVVAEDDAAHARLAGAGLAHEQDFLLLGFLDLGAEVGGARGVRGRAVDIGRHGFGGDRRRCRLVNWVTVEEVDGPWDSDVGELKLSSGGAG